MTKTIRQRRSVSRRKFVVGSAARRPAASRSASTCRLHRRGAAPKTAPTEVNVWVAIKPDDTCVIRVARSEMGQGTITGLAQLVAEELDCDWNKVSTEGITPGRNLASKRAWGEMGTGG